MKRAIRVLTMLFAALMTAGCGDIHSDKDSLMLSTWCTPDGHANWVWASGMQNAVAVPRLDRDGRPVLCTAVASSGSESVGTQPRTTETAGLDSQPRISGGEREQQGGGE